MQEISEPKGLARIWWEIRKPYWAYLYHAAWAAEMKEQLRHFFGEPSEIGKGIDSVKRFYQWSAVFGKRLTQLLSNPFPNREQPDTYFKWFARQVGIDLKKEIHQTAEMWVLDGIKIPQPQNEVDRKCCFTYELPDNVLASYFKHNFENFDCYCDIVGKYLKDFHEGPYEYGDVFIKEGDVVFDCGANTGMFSAVASRYGGEVYAFEAIPEIIDNYLSKAADINKNIRIFSIAVWDKEETLDFSYLVDHICASGCTQILDEVHHKKRCRHVTVPAITLDAFVEQNGIARVDFIKADIEGAERNMLRGATRILREFAPKLSICTYHLPDDPQVLREIILEANPKYHIVEKFKKMYAYVPKENE